MENIAKCIDCPYRSGLTKVLENDELHKLSDSCVFATFKRGDILSSQGSFQSNLIYLREGFVMEYINLNNNENQIIQVIANNNYVGLQSIFYGKTYQSTFKALSDVEICYIEKNNFISLLKNNGKFAHEILKSCSISQLSNYRRYVDISRKQVYGKVAEVLLYLSDVVFKADTFPNLLTQAEVAQMLHTSRESVSRIFSKFKDENVIQIKSKEIKLLDKNKLKDLSHFG